jgi:hypothetical protein
MSELVFYGALGISIVYETGPITSHSKFPGSWHVCTGRGCDPTKAQRAQHSTVRPVSTEQGSK